MKDMKDVWENKYIVFKILVSLWWYCEWLSKIIITNQSKGSYTMETIKSESMWIALSPGDQAAKSSSFKLIGLWGGLQD